jgi:hypothetical protein
MPRQYKTRSLRNKRLLNNGRQCISNWLALGSGMVRTSRVVWNGEWQKKTLTILTLSNTHSGHINVPTSDKPLHSWILKQREQWRLSRANDLHAQISPSQIQQLVEVGLGNTAFGPINPRWEEMFVQLVKFKEEHGHLRVPSMDKKFASLYQVRVLFLSAWKTTDFFPFCSRFSPMRLFYFVVADYAEAGVA